MKNILHQENWNLGAVQVHMDPPQIPLNKIKNDDKLDKYCVKIKLHRDLISQKLKLYEIKMPLFDKGEPEEFLFFIRNSKVTLEELRTLVDSAKI